MVSEEHWKILQNDIEQKFQEKGIEVNSCWCSSMSHGHIAKDEKTIIVLLERRGMRIEMCTVVNVDRSLDEKYDNNGFKLKNASDWTVHEYDKVGILFKTSLMTLNQFFEEWNSK